MAHRTTSSPYIPTCFCITILILRLTSLSYLLSCFGDLLIFHIATDNIRRSKHTLDGRVILRIDVATLRPVFDSFKMYPRKSNVEKLTFIKRVRDDRSNSGLLPFCYHSNTDIGCGSPWI
ncbi:hypothetical protein BDW60DRAFT_175639 [Aspergillus nidulans var. acristatus]